MVKLALLDDYQNAALKMADWGRLPKDVKITVFNDTITDIEGVAKRLQDFEIIGIMRERTPFPRALFEKLPKLKLLVTTGMRNLAIDLAAARDRGVIVCGTDASAGATVEMTWALMLALIRHVPAEDRAMREGRWLHTIGCDLKGRTLGIMGLGRLGSQVAAIAHAFGMKLIAWSQNMTDERAKACGAVRVSKEDLLSQSDIVTIHLLLSDRTRGLMGPAELRLMKPTAYLINTSRGPIVQEQALIDAIKKRQIAGAAMDVYDIEPLPKDHPYRSLENTVLTPHAAYSTEETFRVFYPQMVEDISAYLAGKPIRILNP